MWMVLELTIDNHVEEFYANLMNFKKTSIKKTVMKRLELQKGWVSIYTRIFNIDIHMCKYIGTYIAICTWMSFKKIWKEILIMGIIWEKLKKKKRLPISRNICLNWLIPEILTFIVKFAWNHHQWAFASNGIITSPYKSKVDGKIIGSLPIYIYLPIKKNFKLCL